MAGLTLLAGWLGWTRLRGGWQTPPAASIGAPSAVAPASLERAHQLSGS